jgi:predicted alpha/beta hydrolase
MTYDFFTKKRLFCVFSKANKSNSNAFSKLTAPIKSIIFMDDNLISQKANKKLLAYYSNSTINEIQITPQSVKLNKIGHFGYFSRKSEKLWSNLI